MARQLLRASKGAEMGSFRASLMVGTGNGCWPGEIGKRGNGS